MLCSSTSLAPFPQNGHQSAVGLVTTPFVSSLINPPHLIGLALKNTNLCQILSFFLLNDIGNAICCCLNILLHFGGGL